MTVDDMSGLVAGWKGPRSVPPTVRAIQNLQSVMDLLNATPDHLGAASDGEIIATYLMDDGRRFEFSIHDDEISASVLPQSTK